MKSHKGIGTMDILGHDNMVSGAAGDKKAARDRKDGRNFSEVSAVTEDATKKTKKSEDLILQQRSATVSCADVNILVAEENSNVVPSVPVSKNVAQALIDFTLLTAVRNDCQNMSLTHILEDPEDKDVLQTVSRSKDALQFISCLTPIRAPSVQEVLRKSGTG
ncbi:hypothetical protein FGB62_275g02 [Gracilaria domingensis]|nr:hypothetical protein FGB62_275g02 [Gracilaria domingensis]